MTQKLMKLPKFLMKIEKNKNKTIDEYCKSHLANCSVEKQYSISMTKVDNLTTAS
jgi:hypothetical protein